MEQMQSLDKWHKTRIGHLIFGAAELLIAYGFVSWAINTAHTWTYILAIAFGYGGVRNLVNIFRKTDHGKRKR